MKIDNKINELIESNEKIIRYKQLEKIINENETLLQSLEELKEVQKQIVHAEKLQKSRMLDKLNEDYKVLKDNIEQYPLMSEYLDLQIEINELLKSFKEIIETGINGDLTLI